MIIKMINGPLHKKKKLNRVYINVKPIKVCIQARREVGVEGQYPQGPGSFKNKFLLST